MKDLKRIGAGAAIMAVVVSLILDSKTAIEGAKDGLELCTQTVIPSLFPLIFFTSVLTSRMELRRFKFSKLLCSLFCIPSGSEALLLTGLLGGYPMGARCVGQAAADGQLSEETACRMLVFCNASGPAFIFGIGSAVFQKAWIPWALWGIHILSAIYTARLLSSSCKGVGRCSAPPPVTVPEALRRSIRGMAEICGWIILMRVVITILSKWCLWLLPPQYRVLCIGLLELSNGCLSLSELQDDGLRFIFYSAFLGFGGLCVALQSFSAAAKVSKRLYFPGKLLQCSISALLAGLLHPFLFRDGKRGIFLFSFMAVAGMILVICVYWLKKHKNKGGILNYVGV